MRALSKQRLLPYLALLVGILALTISPLFAAKSTASGPVFAFYRMIAGSVILLPFFVRNQKTEQTRLWGWFLIFPILGGLAEALDLSTWATAIHYTGVATATLLNNTAPIWVALVAWLIFKEKLKGVFWVGLIVAILGAAIILSSDFLTNPSLNVGNLLGTASGLFYGLYYLITQKGRRYLSAIRYTYVMTLSTGVFTLLFSLVLGYPLSGFPLETYLASLGAGIFAQSMGFLSLTYALGTLSASTVSPSMLLQPVLSALLAIPILHQPLKPSQWVGGVAVLGGIYLLNRSLENQPAPAQPPAGLTPDTGDTTPTSS
ncbi:MAG TPA: DMT family transporter [Anaerolineaceae bacterium]